MLVYIPSLRKYGSVRQRRGKPDNLPRHVVVRFPGPPGKIHQLGMVPGRRNCRGKLRGRGGRSHRRGLLGRQQPGGDLPCEILEEKGIAAADRGRGPGRRSRRSAARGNRLRRGSGCGKATQGGPRDHRGVDKQTAPGLEPTGRSRRRAHRGRWARRGGPGGGDWNPSRKRNRKKRDGKRRPRSHPTFASAGSVRFSCSPRQPASWGRRLGRGSNWTILRTCPAVAEGLLVEGSRA